MLYSLDVLFPYSLADALFISYFGNALTDLIGQFTQVSLPFLERFVANCLMGLIADIANQINCFHTHLWPPVWDNEFVWV